MKSSLVYQIVIIVLIGIIVIMVGKSNSDSKPMGEFSVETQEIVEPSVVEPTSESDKDFEAKARANETYFESREEAVNAFKRASFRKFPNYYYRTEPKIRPDYIPGTIRVDGATYDIFYDEKLWRVYGYVGREGDFCFYTPLEDDIMLNKLMRLNHYSYDE